ncbi:MAG: FAD-dependent oxidoreductase [Bacteroidales bacterium]|jgi:pyruvate/2-oxoglutarate dehydrogenase complex dihydrolipoamide dehydrogenase (E3) component|nr:FAD-dependent oxidoreductase [Bacteroidales bacterium]
MTSNYRNIVIGFGKAGRALAKSLAIHGESVLLVEKDTEMYGGTCPNVGCAPSKALIVRANRNENFTQAIAEKRELVLKLRSMATGMLTSESNIVILNGEASFVNDKEITVLLPNGTNVNFTANRIFIDTGATPVMPPISGLNESKNVITTKEALNLDTLPKHFVIIGAGFAGLEFAAMYQRFGAKVSVIDYHKNFIPSMDEDVSEQIFCDMHHDGIQFFLDSQITEIQYGEKHSTIVFTHNGKQHSLIADKILVTTGRKANIAALGLEHTNIQVTPQGTIQVDDKLQTSVSGVWAMGDVRGGLQFYYLSTDDFRIVENQLFGDNTRLLSDRTPVPYCVFINPTLSHIGLTEKEAKAQNIPYRLFKMQAARIVKANVVGDTKGVLKALVNPVNDQILGATLYHEDSHEVINLLAVAIKARIPYTLLQKNIFTHPSMSEGLNDLFSSEIIEA